MTLHCIQISGVNGLGSKKVVYKGYKSWLMGCHVTYAILQNEIIVDGIKPATGLMTGNHIGHVCCPIGKGYNFYGFSIVIDIVFIKVYEDVGFQLLGIDGQRWWETFGPKAWPMTSFTISTIFGQYPMSQIFEQVVCTSLEPPGFVLQKFQLTWVA